MELEAASNDWSDGKLVGKAIQHLNHISAAEKKDILEHNSNWSDLKTHLVKSYSLLTSKTGQNSCFVMKGSIRMLKSLVKAPNEKFFHFLTRVRHVSNLLVQ